MLSWLAPIIVFGLVVFVHELGHFIAAKITGVYAPRFSIGFGPSLLKKRFGETEYILAALPLGGYVRMASREDEATAFLEGGNENSATRAANPKDGYDPNAMIPFGPKPIPESRWFESKPLVARLFIMLAGVTMNALLAYGIYAGLLLHSGMPTPIPVAAGRFGYRQRRRQVIRWRCGRLPRANQSINTGRSSVTLPPESSRETASQPSTATDSSDGRCFSIRLVRQPDGRSISASSATVGPSRFT